MGLILKLILVIGFTLAMKIGASDFDFHDARSKGYSDKEILDFVYKNLKQYDISSIRQAGLSDTEIVDFFIQKDTANYELKNLARASYNHSNSMLVYPQDVSLQLAMGCMVYTGRIKNQNDGWRYISKLTDFATAIYSEIYLREANYFEIDKNNGVSLKHICLTWLDKLQSQEELSKLYALSIVNEIDKIVKQEKSLIID